MIPKLYVRTSAVRLRELVFRLSPDKMHMDSTANASYIVNFGGTIFDSPYWASVLAIRNPRSGYSPIRDHRVRLFVCLWYVLLSLKTVIGDCYWTILLHMSRKFPFLWRGQCICCRFFLNVSRDHSPLSIPTHYKLRYKWDTWQHLAGMKRHCYSVICMGFALCRPWIL